MSTKLRKTPDGIDHGGHGEPQRRMQFWFLCSSVLSVVTRFTAPLTHRHSPDNNSAAAWKRRRDAVSGGFLDIKPRSGPIDYDWAEATRISLLP